MCLVLDLEDDERELQWQNDVKVKFEALNWQLLKCIESAYYILHFHYF